jgi:hypothetical protein
MLLRMVQRGSTVLPLRPIFFAPADLRGDLGGDQQNRPRDGAAFLHAHLAEVLAVEQLLRAIGGNRKLL